MAIYFLILMNFMAMYSILYITRRAIAIQDIDKMKLKNSRKLEMLRVDNSNVL